MTKSSWLHCVQQWKYFQKLCILHFHSVFYHWATDWGRFVHVSSCSEQRDDQEQVGERFLWALSSSCLSEWQRPGGWGGGGGWLFLFNRKWEQLSADLDWQRGAAMRNQASETMHILKACKQRWPSPYLEDSTKREIVLTVHDMLLVMSHFVDILHEIGCVIIKGGVHPHFPLRVRMKPAWRKTPIPLHGCAGWGWGVSVTGYY